MRSVQAATASASSQFRASASFAYRYDRNSNSSNTLSHGSLRAFFATTPASRIKRSTSSVTGVRNSAGTPFIPRSTCRNALSYGKMGVWPPGARYRREYTMRISANRSAADASRQAASASAVESAAAGSAPASSRHARASSANDPSTSPCARRSSGYANAHDNNSNASAFPTARFTTSSRPISPPCSGIFAPKTRHSA